MSYVTVVVVALATVLGHVYCASPVEYGKLSISFAPSTEMVINEGETQLFRATLCNKDYIDGWNVKVELFLQNVPWDARQHGDDNWLKLVVSNKPDMSNVMCQNYKTDKTGSNSAQTYCQDFTYSKKDWGADKDLYVAVTARSGTPTFQYGVNVLITPQDEHSPAPNPIPKGVSAAPAASLPLNIMEQVAVPYHSELPVGSTGQYLIPFCFDNVFFERRIQVTTLVRDNVDQGAGGVATYLCSNDQVEAPNYECFRSVVKQAGHQFYDASGAKINAVTPVIRRRQFGVMRALVLAQGDYGKSIKFTLTAKLRLPDKHALPDGDATKMESLMKCVNKHDEL